MVSDPTQPLDNGNEASIARGSILEGLRDLILMPECDGGYEGGEGLEKVLKGLGPLLDVQKATQVLCVSHGKADCQEEAHVEWQGGLQGFGESEQVFWVRVHSTGLDCCCCWRLPPPCCQIRYKLHLLLGWFGKLAQ